MLPLEPSLLDSGTDPAAPDSQLVHAAAAVDSHGVIAPAAILVRNGRIVAVDEPARIGRAEAEPLSLHDTVVLPGLVNPHTHLDLTSVGPISLELGFEGWLAEVRRQRPQDAEAVAQAVDLGVRRSLRGGVIGVGDIAGAFGLDAARALAASGMAGVSFVELFGIGRRLEGGLARLEEILQELAGSSLARPGFQVGFSPHAPYSCGPAIYEAVAATGLPASTHLAETPEEAEFTRRGTGPMRELLRRIGAVGDDDPEADLESTTWEGGIHPIDGLLGIAPTRPWVLAHLNYPEELDEESPSVFERRAAGLRAAGAVVVFCPRAARFLGHPRPGRDPHPWSRLVQEGIEVALGTDGMPCLETEDRLSPLDDARLLWQDGVAVEHVVRMMTTAGARALGLSEAEFTWKGSGAAGLIGLAIDRPAGTIDRTALGGALSIGREAPTWLLSPRPADLAG